MTKKQYAQKKLSTICTIEAYGQLVALIKEHRPNNPYPLPPETYYYRNTKHREYLSKFLEEVIIRTLSLRGFEAKKVNTRGKMIDQRKTYTDVLGNRKTIGSMTWVKDHTATKGEPDVKSLMYGVTVYWEVKIGADKLSPEQIAFKERGKGRYIVEVVKTVDEFLQRFEALDNMLRLRERKIMQLNLGI